MFRQKVIWSPVEIEYLKSQLKKEIDLNQLSIALSKSRNAINKKIKELKTGKIEQKSKNVAKSNIGKRKDLNNIFYRSNWEANFARICNLNDQIKKTEYEPVDFSFYIFGVKKGTVTYTPDFRLTYNDNKWDWVEIKGYLKPQDKTKIRRFQKYYPEDFKRLVAITPGENTKTYKFFSELGVRIIATYPQLRQQYKHLIPNWE